jgi:hypothetical protein
MPLVSQTFDQLLDFTRTTAGSFVGSNGLIQNTPASVNLFTQTQQFDNAAWTKNATTATPFDPATAPLGNNVVVNGDFASATGWTASTGWVIGSGVATATATSSSLFGGFTPVSGQWYKITFDCTVTSGTLFVVIGLGTAASFSTSGTKTVYLQSGASTSRGIEFYGGAVTGTVDNIVVQAVTINNIVAPDGTSTADTLTATATTAVHNVQQTAGGFGSVLTLSVYAKAGTSNFLQLWHGISVQTYANFNLSTGAVGTVGTDATASITNAGNGWYRCTIVFTPFAAGTPRIALVTSGTAAYNESWTATGTEGVFIWGAQIEAVPAANLVLGSELVTNPGPFSDTTGWTAAVGTLSTSSGSLVLTIGVAGSARAVSSAMSGLTIGAAYRINVSGVAGTATTKSIRITTNADGSTGALFTQTVAGTSITYDFVATATTHYLALIAANAENQTFSVSQASVKQITAITGMPSTYTRNNGGVFPPRFDYDPVTLAPKGILIEEQRVNLVTYSEQFDNAAWSKINSTITPDATTSPDGTVDADKMIAADGIAIASCSIFSPAISKSAVATTYTYTAYAKASEFNRVRLYIQDAATTANLSDVIVSLVDGSITSAARTIGAFSSASAVVLNAGAGWWRVCLTFTSSTETALRARIYPADSVATTGNGTSGIFIYGAQLEAGAFATSYIPTVASQVTRAADQTSIVAPNFAPWYNQSEGTFVVEADTVNPSNKWLYAANDGTATTYVGLDLASAGNARFRVVIGGVSQAGLSSAAVISANTIVKQAGAYANNSFNQAVDGVLNSGDTSGSVPTVLQFIIGAQTSLGGFLNGHIRSIRYYPVRLSDAQLEALTA